MLDTPSLPMLIGRGRVPTKPEKNMEKKSHHNPEHERRHSLKRKYGLTVEEYEMMLNEQEGVCAICRKPPTKDRRLAVDHCHKAGHIRGLLCTRCNVALGLFDEDAGRVLRAYDYL